MSETTIRTDIVAAVWMWSKDKEILSPDKQGVPSHNMANPLKRSWIGIVIWIFPQIKSVVHLAKAYPYKRIHINPCTTFWFIMFRQTMLVDHNVVGEDKEAALSCALTDSVDGHPWVSPEPGGWPEVLGLRTRVNYAVRYIRKSFQTKYQNLKTRKITTCLHKSHKVDSESTVWSKPLKYPCSWDIAFLRMTDGQTNGWPYVQTYRQPVNIMPLALVVVRVEA